QYTYNGIDYYNSGDTIKNLGAGIYNLTIEDISGCTKDTTITINEPTEILISTTVTDITCYGADDGQIEITASGGTPGYTYSIDSASTWFPGNIFTPLNQDTFYVSVQDGLGCIQFGDTIIMSYPDSITIDSVWVTPVICDGSADDGTITVFAHSATGDLDYSINNGVDFYPDSLFTGLAGGDYQIVVQNVNACGKPLDSLVTVNGPIIITYDSVVHNVCYGDTSGVIKLEFTGGSGALQYSHNGTDWYNSGDTIKDLGAAIYTVTIEDAIGCTKDTTITINEPGPISISIDDITSITCHDAMDGAITISASGGVAPYNYSITEVPDFTNTTGIFTALDSGNVYIAARDANMCITYGDTIYFANPDTISIDSIITVPYTCLGANDDGEIIIYASRGVGTLEFSIDNINFQTDSNFTGLIGGTYSVYVRDDCGTTALLDTATITGPIPIVIDSIIIADVTCYDENTGQLTIYASGGTGNYEYSINGAEPYVESNLFTGLYAGPYTISVRDDNDCTSPDSIVNIGQPTELVITVDVTHASECNATTNTGIITVNATGGTISYLYNITGYIPQMSPTFSGLDLGDYTVTVEDANGCQTTLDTSIILKPSMSISLNEEHIRCHDQTDGSITVDIENGTPNYLYSWVGPEGFISSAVSLNNLSTAGTYSVTVTDDNFNTPCVDNASVEIIKPDTLKVGFTIKDKYCINCDSINSSNFKGAINADATGGNEGYSYNWTGPGGFSSPSYYITDLDAGTYNLTVTDSKGCDTTYNTVVKEDESFDITNLDIEFDDYSVCWNMPAIFTASFTGNKTDTIFYQIVENIDDKWIARDVSFVEINTNPMRVEDYLQGDAVYNYIRLTNQYCKNDVKNIDVTFFSDFELDIELDGIGNNDTLYLKGTTSGNLGALVLPIADISFVWTPSETLSTPNSQATVVTPDESGWYKVVATSTDNCVDSSMIFLEFIPAIYPNSGFSPNGDGINDYWKIKHIGKFKNNIVTVYSRWGVKVFEQKGYDNYDISKSWDGNAKNGKNLPSGTYYYVIILNEEGFPAIKGSITIIR
ncbi:MAG: gliding motility-associated C-terminal domain-containing protein, partial [Bacteroidales bacterium]|nr:gliding motility-associated C-terminal domain-containing protein [Bacteroidales bacterium]